MRTAWIAAATIVALAVQTTLARFLGGSIVIGHSFVIENSATPMAVRPVTRRPRPKFLPTAVTDWTFLLRRVTSNG